MRKTNLIFGSILASGLLSVSSFGQTSCTDWENEYVLNKDNNLGVSSYDLMMPGDQLAQTYHYSGEGMINAIRVRGYVPGIFISSVDLRIRIYNVDGNNRPTTPITGYIYATYYDSPGQSNLINIPTTFVDGNFAVSIQVYDNWRTFACKSNEPNDGNGEDLASYRNSWSTGTWGSTMDDLDDVDYYLEPLMSHTNNASFEIVGGNCHPTGNVSFDNNSVVSDDEMFNQSATVYAWNFGDATSSNLENPTHTYAAGSYTVTLTTTHQYYNGLTCTSVATQEISVGMSVAATVTNATCFGSENGSVTGTVSNGNSPYSFWTSENGTTGLGAGNYVLYAEDDLGCGASTAFTVTQNPEIVFGNPTVTSATCGNADGAILVVATGGTGTLQYSINGGTTYQSSGYFNGVQGGEVIITVKDASSFVCTSSMSFVIPETSAPNISLFSSTNTTCNGDLDGEIVVVGNGGTGALEFSIDGGDNYQTSGTFANLGAGTYTVLIQDNLGCSNGINEIEITSPDEIGFNLSSESVSCFGGSDGSITVSNVIGGTGTFQYSIDGTTYQSSLTFNGLTAGNYTVYAKDAKDCEASMNITVTQPSILIVSNTHVNPTCNGETSGSILVSASGGSGEYTYDISGDGNEAQGFDQFYGVGAGIYNIVVTDENGCQANTTSVVTEPAPVSANLVSGSSTCLGSDGSIGVTSASGGSGSGYQYSFDEGSTWNNIPGNILGLTAGTYDVIIRDGFGCLVDYQSAVTNIGVTPVLTTLNHSDVTCNGGNNGSITVSTGVATDQYSIGFGFQSSGVFTNLPAGTYSVVVKNIANCELAATIVSIIEPNGFVISTTETEVDCNGGSDGSVTVLASGGAGTISYSIDGFTFQSGNVISDLAAGEYDLTIQDALGCFGYANFLIEEPTPIVAFASNLDVTCNGSGNGVIYLGATGGTPGYMYSINGSTYGTSTVFSGLDGGIYTAYIKDSKNCVANTVVLVKEPAALELNVNISNVSCAGGDNGVIDLTVTGGVDPYSYLWIKHDAVSTSEDIFNLDPGNYSLTVTDANGCTATGSYTVSAPLNPVVVNGTVTDASGVSANDGEIDVTATGGTPPYFYDWSNGSTAADQTGLAPGVYTVEVTDGAGCSVSSTFTVSYSTGISETEEDGYSISVYPNPANVVLNITIANADVQLITLVDLQGKIVYSDASGDVNTQISLADFANGVYFVNVQSSKGMTTKKVIVSK